MCHFDHAIGLIGMIVSWTTHVTGHRGSVRHRVRLIHLSYGKPSTLDSMKTDQRQNLIDSLDRHVLVMRQNSTWKLAWWRSSKLTYTWNICFAWGFIFSGFFTPRPGRTENEINTHNDSNDPDLRKDVPFVGFLDLHIYLRVQQLLNLAPKGEFAASRKTISNLRAERDRQKISTDHQYEN